MRGPVAKAMQDFVTALEALDGRIPPRDDLRDLYRLVRCVCLAYVSPNNWANSNPREPFPKTLAVLVEGHCGWLMLGRIPGPIADVVGPGDPKAPPPELRDQRLVAAYVVACKDGRISDPKPVDRMAVACGRHRSRIQAWVKKLRSLPDRDDFLQGDIEKTAFTAAEGLRRHGRSQAAIRERGKAPRKRAQVSRGR